MIRFLIPAILAGMLASAPTAHATAIPGPTEAVTCVFNPVSGGATIQHGTTDCSVGGSTATIATAPNVSLFATGGEGPNSNSSMGSASLAYFFEVLGGTQFEQIPILITTDLSAGFTGNGGAGASITITPQPLAPTFDVVGKTVCANVDAISCPSSEGASFDGTLNGTALEGVAGQVELFASGGGGGTNGGSGTATADPLIQIDPTFLLNHPGLTLDFSPGVVNGLPSAVPEPSAFVLLATALAGLAGLRRRRRRS